MTIARRPDTATIVAFAGVVLLGGLNTIAVKVIVADLAPSWAAALRFLLAAALIGGVVLVTRRDLPRGRSLGGAVLYGAVAFAGSYALLYAALEHANAGTVAVFLALVPLETFLLAVLQREEQFHGRALVGALIALGGVALVMLDRLGAEVPVESLLLILGGTLFIAEGAVVLKAIPRADPYATNAVAMLTGGVILAAVSAATGEPWVLPSNVGTWAVTAYLVVLGSIGLFGLYLFAVRRWTASGVSYATLFMPLVAVPLAAVLVDESVSLSFVVGGGIALLGSYVGAFSTVRPQRSTATSAPECLPIQDCPELVPAR